MEEGSRRGDRFPYERLPTPPLPPPSLNRPCVVTARLAHARDFRASYALLGQPTRPSVRVYDFSRFFGRVEAQKFSASFRERERKEGRKEGKSERKDWRRFGMPGKRDNMLCYRNYCRGSRF